MGPEEDRVDHLLLQLEGKVLQLEGEPVEDEGCGVVKEDQEDDVTSGAVEEEGPRFKDVLPVLVVSFLTPRVTSPRDPTPDSRGSPEYHWTSREDTTSHFSLLSYRPFTCNLVELTTPFLPSLVGMTALSVSSISVSSSGSLPPILKDQRGRKK